MDEFVEPNKDSGGSWASCLAILIVTLVAAGLIMWIFLWGRAAPKGDPSRTQRTPATQVQPAN